MNNNNSIRQRNVKNNLEDVKNRPRHYEIIDTLKPVPENITKVVEFDNVLLNISYKEYLIFEEIISISKITDNCFRIILPTIYFIIIIIIFSFFSSN